MFQPKKIQIKHFENGCMVVHMRGRTRIQSHQHQPELHRVPRKTPQGKRGQRLHDPRKNHGVLQQRIPMQGISGPPRRMA